MLDDVGGNEDGGMAQQRWRRVKWDIVTVMVWVEIGEMEKMREREVGFEVGER